VLQSSGRSTHSLGEEIRLCHAYLEVERARFGDRLAFDVRIDPAIDSSAVTVPVLLLQPLVENAVRHGIGSRASGGSVGIRVDRAGERLRMRVDDDGVGLGRSPQKGQGIAVDNCKRRLALAYGGKATLTLRAGAEAGTCATIELPSVPPS
jgi:LytS/YehU family sensor histidine kinase